MKPSGYVFILLGLWLAACSNVFDLPSPGAGDARLTGTWRLYEQSYLRDSTYRTDSTFTRDTTYRFVRRYNAVPPQTLTFGADGSVRASGTAMTYYFPVRYYRVDSSFLCNAYYSNVHFYILTNRSFSGPQQRLTIRGDTLLLNAQCDSVTYLKLLRVR